jgi:hypothetical protein
MVPTNVSIVLEGSMIRKFLLEWPVMALPVCLVAAVGYAFCSQSAPAAEQCPGTSYSLNESKGPDRLAACFWKADEMNVAVIKRHAHLYKPIVYVLRFTLDGEFESLIGISESALSPDMEEHSSDDLVTQIIRPGNRYYEIAKRAVDEIANRYQEEGPKPDSPALAELMTASVPTELLVRNRWPSTYAEGLAALKKSR